MVFMRPKRPPLYISFPGSNWPASSKLSAYLPLAIAPIGPFPFNTLSATKFIPVPNGEYTEASPGAPANLDTESNLLNVAGFNGLLANCAFTFCPLPNTFLPKTVLSSPKILLPNA